MGEDLSTSALSRIARSLYNNVPTVYRLLQGYRPLICPFGELIQAIPSGVRILDIGCGGGVFLGLLAHFGKITHGTGLDTNVKAIEMANIMRETCSGKDRLKFKQLDLEQYWPTEIFDVVSIIDVIHHVPPEKQTDVIRKAMACVSRGGTFVYKDITEKPMWRLWASRIHDLILAHQYISVLSFKTLVETAQDCGFSLSDHQTINLLWYGHELAVFKRKQTSTQHHTT